jgi:2'-5' RNA ligase
LTFTVELRFDPKTDATFQAVWARLAEQGISTSMLDFQARPHVTLSATAEMEAQSVQPWLKKLAAEIGIFEVLFQSLGIFPTVEGVVFFAPAVTQSLLDLHRRFHQECPGSWCAAPYYAPHRWVPHSTAAVGLNANHIANAIAVCMETPLPLAGWFAELALTEVQPRQPVREIMTVILTE